jgi:hypothetical protein
MSAVAGRKRGRDAIASVQRRVIAEVDTALKRRPPSEAKLAGAARVMACVAPPVRASLAAAAEVLGRRKSFDRELWAGSIRTLAEAGDKRGVPVLAAALACDDGGGFATLSAACFSDDPALAAPLARVAGSRHAHVAFAAEVARLARGEPSGAHLASVAPMIKESHRIALCVEIFVPLARAKALPPGIAPALTVLRDAERHLGRWLVLAEVATRAGDRGPLEEARSKAAVGPESSRAAWAFVAWALEPAAAAPTARPTSELVARLSDRPSSDKDTTFLFRLGDARVASARAMLEALARTQPLAEETAVRAARCLARGYGRPDLVQSLVDVGADAEREHLRGLAAAALWDVGEHDRAIALANELVESKALCSSVWAAAVQQAALEPGADVLVEPRFRRLQWGWTE